MTSEESAAANHALIHQHIARSLGEKALAGIENHLKPCRGQRPGYNDC